MEGTFAGTYFWKAEFEEGFKEGGDPPPPFPPPVLAVSPAAATASSFVEAEGVWYFEAVPLMLLELSLDTGSSTAVLLRDVDDEAGRKDVPNKSSCICLAADW